MVARRPLIVGNWKMNLGLDDASTLARQLKRKIAGLYAGPEAAVCPSAPHLITVREILEGSTIAVGAQDLVAQAPGAVTGGICAEQLRELGLRFVIIGHSERRQLFGETDEQVGEKIRAAFRVGLTPIVCVGETLEQRESGQTEEVVIRQLRGAFDGLEPVQVGAVVVAYEPVWAIGTGRNAEPADVQAVHRLGRGFLREKGGTDRGDAVRILYGGSVNESNITEYMDCEDVDGALVGGASLDADRFLSILRYQDQRR